MSKQVFSQLDDWIWKKLWKWSYQRHPNKSKRWVAHQYYHTIGQDNWKFSVKDTASSTRSRQAILAKLASIPIVRHVKIRGEFNPYDKAFTNYLIQRQKKSLSQWVRKKETLFLLKRQKGKCPLCQFTFALEDKWRTYINPTQNKNGAESINSAILHRNCYQQLKEQVAAGWPLPAIF